MSLPRPSRKIGEQPAATTDPKQVPRIDPNNLRPSDVFTFDPETDITPYELAYLIRKFYAPAIHFKHYLELPEQMQRHFKIAKL